MSEQHIPVMLQEAVQAWLGDAPRDGVFVDATFGRGGHSQALLPLLGAAAKLIALDQDLSAVAAAQHIKDPRFQIHHSNFAQLGQVLQQAQVSQIHGLLLDLGVSSAQLDTPERGFSFRFDAPLDMRMDTSQGMTVAEFLATADAKQISEVLHELGDERAARNIAAKLVDARQSGTAINRTGQLAALVASVVKSREAGQHPATRTFQALRIKVNDELGALQRLLGACLDWLAPGAQLVVISFHSLEDRIVKRFMQQLSRPPVTPRGIAALATPVFVPQLLLRGKFNASEQECRANPRARSAIMRVAQRLPNQGSAEMAGVAK